MLSISVGYRRMLGYVLVVLIGFALLWCGAPGSLRADEVLQSAPLNPQFIRYFQDKAAGKLQTVTEEGYPLGHIPPPILLPSLKKKVLTSAPIVSALPATFDLRTVNGLTEVRDQRNCGSCWTFASLGSLESYLKYKVSQTWNFSEQDLNQYHGFTPRECEGGNFLMSTAYLARWSGPVGEMDMPYSYAAPGAPIKKHVQRVWFLPDRTSKTDNDLIKTAVQTYGAVYMSFQWSSAYYNAATYSYYTTLTGGNHAVAIVGWEDNYPKTNFNAGTQPPGDGAFIVKNSWGTGWGESGYFYISYYDNSLRASASFYNAEPITNYSQAYEYDPLGLVNMLVYCPINSFT